MQYMQAKDQWEFRIAEDGDKVSSNRMLKSVFMDVLRSIGIQICVVESADNAIAGLANHYKCPVLSSDSDFFLFQLHAGVIQIDHWLEEKISARMFNLELFMKQFSLREYEQCLIIPAVKGNKVKSSSHEWIRLLHEVSKCSWQKYLQQQDSSLKTADHFQEAKEFYCKYLPPSLEDGTTTTIAAAETVPAAAAENVGASIDKKEVIRAEVTADAHPLPKWIFIERERGCFLTFLITAFLEQHYHLPKVVEVIEKQSAWNFSTSIRQYLYGFLCYPSKVPVKEIIREDYYPRFTEVSVLPKFLKSESGIIPIAHPLFTSEVTEDKEKRSDLVLAVLKCHKISEEDIEKLFNPLDDKWKLPIAATFFWYLNLTTPTDIEQRRDLLISLLLSFLTCSGIIPYDVPPLPPVNPRTRSAHLTALHAFAQWQCVYYDARALNYLAREPFPTTSLASLYSGEVAMHYATIVSHQEDWLAGVVVRNSDQWKLINTFLQLIVTGRQEKRSTTKGWTKVKTK